MLSKFTQLSLILSTIFVVSFVGCGGGGNASSQSVVVPATIASTGYSGLMVSTSTVTYTSFNDLNFFISNAYAANEVKKLIGIKDGSIKTPEFFDANSVKMNTEVSDVKDVGGGYLLVTFYKAGNAHKFGLLEKSTGQIDDVTALVDDADIQYVVTRGNLMYVGKPSAKTIYEVNLTTKTSRKVNDPAVNPVRFFSGFSGSGGGMVIAKDFQNGGNIVLAPSDTGATCSGAQTFCLFFADGTVQPLDNIDPNYPNRGGDASWPGLSLMYGGDDHIYSWNAISSYTGQNVTFEGYFFKYEYSKTPFLNGKNGKLTKKNIVTLTGIVSDGTFLGFNPQEIPVRDNGWYDPNKDKNFIIPQGVLKVVKDTGTGVVTMTWIAVDLTASTNTGGAGSPLCWSDPILNTQKCEWPYYVYNGYFYWYKSGELKRIQLTSGATPELLSTSNAIVNFSITGGKLFYMTSTKTFSMDLLNLAGGAIEEFSQNIYIQSPVDL